MEVISLDYFFSNKERKDFFWEKGFFKSEQLYATRILCQLVKKNISLTEVLEKGLRDGKETPYDNEKIRKNLNRNSLPKDTYERMCNKLGISPTISEREQVVLIKVFYTDEYMIYKSASHKTSEKVSALKKKIFEIEEEVNSVMDNLQKNIDTGELCREEIMLELLSRMQAKEIYILWRWKELFEDLHYTVLKFMLQYCKLNNDGKRIISKYLESLWIDETGV